MKATLRRAVALKYWTGLPAPFVCASARGENAQRLVEMAEKAQVPIIKDQALSSRLAILEEGAFIPEECYEIIAKVFAFIKHIEES